MDQKTFEIVRRTTSINPASARTWYAPREKPARTESVPTGVKNMLDTLTTDPRARLDRKGSKPQDVAQRITHQKNTTGLQVRNSLIATGMRR